MVVAALLFGILIQDFLGAYNAASSAGLMAFASANETARALADETPTQFAQRLIRRHSRTGDLTLVDDGTTTQTRQRASYLARGAMQRWFQVQVFFDETGAKIDELGIDNTIAPPKALPSTHRHADIGRAISAYVAQLSKDDEFSGVVAWASASAPTFEASVGKMDRTKGTPVVAGTQFNIASIGKIFTHIAILQLIQDGKLKATDTIGDVLPDYPNKQARSATIAQLLDMRSGIGDIFGPAFMNADHRQIKSLADYLPLFVSEPLAFAPGTSQMYSNGGYIVLGLIVEKLTGQSYYDYVRAHIFEPAKMANTGYPLRDDASTNVALGYMSGPNGLESNLETQPERGSSAGGAYSTAGDLLALATALKSGVLLQASFAKELNRSENGFAIAGGSPGTNAFFVVNFATSDVLVVLSNMDPPSAEALGQRIRTWIAAATT